LVAWCRRLLEFYLSRGTDFGWIPESITAPRRSETCAVADVINIAEWVAQCGYPHYWDTMERFVRNYIRQAQFFITPEYEALYRSLHPGENGEKGLQMARKLQGGFQGAMGLTDRVWSGNRMDMMGCCVPEGMRAVYTAWKNTVHRDAGGVRVNMSFHRDAPEARVTSLLPDQGRLEVTARINHNFYLRPPAWTPREDVRLYRNGLPRPTLWRGAYVFVEGVNAGERLALTYPLLSFEQQDTIPTEPNQPERKLRVSWVGNTVVRLEPGGSRLPLYS
ncbi:MAG: hypothetical protein NTY38_16380, partial [Acidobacteria bacterium]|nr:hypothetical protein [Acidobacteriota bacterium]